MIPKTTNTVRAEPVVGTNFKLVYDEEAYNKIMYYVRKSDHEVSGFGQVEFNPQTNTFHVRDAFLIDQENTGTSSEIDGMALSKAMFKRKDIPNGLKLHWHSHVNMNTFWSADDMNIIRGLGQQSWVVASVFNKREEVRSAFYELTTVMGNKHEMFIDDITTVVSKSYPMLHELMPVVSQFVDAKRLKNFMDEMKPLLDRYNVNALSKEQTDAWDAEYKACVKEKTYPVSNYYSAGYPSRDTQGSFGLSSEDEWSYAAWSRRNYGLYKPSPDYGYDGWKNKDGRPIYNPARDNTINDTLRFEELCAMQPDEVAEVYADCPKFRKFYDESFGPGSAGPGTIAP